MRLVTRSDFDGLACGALLKEIGLIDSWKFAHPKDLQDGLVEITENDVLANVPFVEGAACGSTIIPASMSATSLPENIRAKAVSLLPVPALFMNTTAEKSVFPTLTI